MRGAVEMESEDISDRRYRENFLEAKQMVRDRESRFATSAMQSLQYCVVSNATAVAAIGAFIGSAGKDIANLSIVVIPLACFLVGLIAAGAALAVYVTNDEKNLEEAISSLISAAHAGNVQLFNDQHNGRSRYDLYVRRLLIGAFLAFVIGLCAGAVIIPFIEYRAPTGNKPEQSESAPPNKSRGTVVSRKQAAGVTGSKAVGQSKSPPTKSGSTAPDGPQRFQSPTPAQSAQ
jgi:Na+/H+-translocating membrane pyrophosphatase